jgi:small conductance mechanosensitive channel
MNIDLAAISANALNLLTVVGLKIIGALIIWVIGRALIRLAVNLLDRALMRQGLDATVAGYIKTSAGVLLSIALIVALLGFFGVETTTFAALLAGVGLAIGAAWSGLLSNFASGVFLVVLRPFRVGDFVSAGGVTGTIQSIGLFGTTVVTPDNVVTIVGNSKMLGDNIQNFSANPYRRVDLKAQLAHTADHTAAITMLKERLRAIPNVLSQPAPDVEILEFTMAGPVLAVRPYCSNTHYWQVYFDTNRLIRESFQTAGFPVPEQHYSVRSMSAAAAAGGN